MTSTHPQLSVIIPAYNASETLEQCLSALAASRFQNLEVIVVDDGSSDDTATIASRFSVRVVSLEANLGPAAARNAGAEVASAPLLFFLDADILLPPTLLDRAVKVLEDRPEFSALFCSFGKETVPTDTCSRHKNLVHHSAHQAASPEAVTFCGGFGLIWRTAFVAVGRFDPQQRYLEDIDLGYRLYRNGHRIYLAKDLQATHAKAYTPASLLRSDLFGRALPWTRLMLKYRIFRNDLNTRVHNVISVLAACALPLSIAVSCGLTAGIALLLLWLNRDLLRLGVREYGVAFAARSALLCWLGYVASAAGVVLGIVSWLWELRFGNNINVLERSRIT